MYYKQFTCTSPMDAPVYSQSISYTYNSDGIRTSKTVNGIEHRYFLNGSQVLAERWTKNGAEYYLHYVYDETGSPIAIQYRTSTVEAKTYLTFFLEKNLQGDIVAIYNEYGTKIGTYTYDAWGVCTSTATADASTIEQTIVSTYNPFRYRGYYYDVQTGLYYLQSRYYNPQWGRFISADSYISTGQGLLGNNMFAYCNNNPVLNIDPSGKCLFTIFLVVAIVTIVNNHKEAAEIISRIEANPDLQETYVPSNDNSEDGEASSPMGTDINAILEKYKDEPGGAPELKKHIDGNIPHYVITNSHQLSKEDRLAICVILSRCDQMNRSALNLAAEWEAHNFLYTVSFGMSKAAESVNLELDFGNNEWYTKAATYVAYGLGAF